MEQKEINTFFFIFHVTFPLFPYYKGRKSNKKRNDYDLHHPKSHHPDMRKRERLWDELQRAIPP